MRRDTIRSSMLWAALAWCGLLWACAAAAEPPAKLPHVVIITVDTLRYDRVSVNGYRRPTSPNIDALLEDGVHFTQARVPEPLTAPSMCSMLTSLYPHEHGTTRNGLKMRPGLASLPKILQQRGYKTSAFIGNWTLKNQLSGLGEHFMSFDEVFDRKRWFGMWFAEATAKDLTEKTLAWVDEHFESSRRPFFTWVHYVEPHEPYRFHKEFASELGITSSDPGPKDRYDTEVAFVDRAIGELIAGISAKAPRGETLILFASDHGESLGEHDYWGHGRHLYDATLHIPLGFAWNGTVEPRTIDAPASLLDLTPTVLGLLGLEVPTALRGFDWSPVLSGRADEPSARITHYQAHKGAARGGSTNARRQGLLEVGRIEESGKEVLRVRSGNRRIFDLSEDAAELRSLVELKSEPSGQLAEWLEQVREGLAASDELPPPSLDEESIEQLRALGYID
ncbi:MAG: sulfatase [bacterium]|nr:sulfatase [bacterium]